MIDSINYICIQHFLELNGLILDGNAFRKWLAQEGNSSLLQRYCDTIWSNSLLNDHYDTSRAFSILSERLYTMIQGTAEAGDYVRVIQAEKKDSVSFD